MVRQIGSYDSDDEGMVDDILRKSDDINVGGDNDVAGGKKTKNISDEDASTYSSCLRIFSKMMFSIGSGLYLWLAIDMLAFYQHYEGLPYDVVMANDDVTWWNYYNETNSIPDSVLKSNNADVRTAWYESTLLDNGQDDYIFEAIIPGRVDSRVSMSMSLHFAAAMCFLLSGLMECCAARTCRGRFLYLTMILAASFGMASASLTEKDFNLAIIFNCVSVQLFALLALALLFGCDDGDGIGRRGCRRLCTILAHLFFVLGTAVDVALSYFYVFEQFEVWHSYMAIGAAACWSAAAVGYVTVAASAGLCNGSRGGGSANKAVDGDSDLRNKEEDDDGSDDDGSEDEYGYLKKQAQKRPEAPVDPTDANDEASITSFWTAGPGPENKEDIARSSLDAIFGRTSTATKSESYD